MTKKIIYWSIITSILSLIGYFFISNFDLFSEDDNQKEVELKSKCDPEGIRKIRMTSITENATTNGSIHIYVTDCNDDEYSYHELVFNAKTTVIDSNLLNFEWKNMDTVIVEYNKKLIITEKQIKPETIKPKLIIEYKTK